MRERERSTKYKKKWLGIGKINYILTALADAA